MTDRELLEMAAKAAGVEITWALMGDTYAAWLPNELLWSPLNDDGDALRLAVKLNLSMDLFDKEILVGYTTKSNQCDQVTETCSNDPYAATRRAIVRAAAEIGKNLK